jgi:tyrosine-protein phosphatase SIW14
MSEDNLWAPLGFAYVSPGIYRSAYPRKKTWSFIESLRLKSMICVSPSDIKDDLIDFCKVKGINLVLNNIGHNQEPFIVMSSSAMTTTLNFLSG